MAWVLSCKCTVSIPPGPALGWREHHYCPKPLASPPSCSGAALEQDGGREVLGSGHYHPSPPMDILVSPWVAQRICPVGPLVLLEYGGRCAEDTWPQSVVEMAQGSSLLQYTRFAINACNFQRKWSRSPHPSPTASKYLKINEKDPAAVLTCRKLRCALSQVTQLLCSYPSSLKWRL